MTTMEDQRMAAKAEKVKAHAKLPVQPIRPLTMDMVDHRRMVEHKTHTEPTTLESLITEFREKLLNYNVGEAMAEGILGELGQLFGDVMASLTGVDVGALIGDVLQDHQIEKMLNPDRDVVKAYFDQRVFFTVAIHPHPQPKRGFSHVYLFKAQDLDTHRVITMEMGIYERALCVPFDPHFGMVLPLDD